MGEDHACDERIIDALEKALDLLNDKDLQKDLVSESSDKFARDWCLPEGAGKVLLTIVNSLEATKSEEKKAAIKSNLNQGVGDLAAKDKEEIARQMQKEKEELEETTKILKEFFTHIKYSFWMSFLMSAILFVIGMTFMAIVLWQSRCSEQFSNITYTFAGLGLADFLILFYTRPWQDISSNLENAQRHRIIAITYQIGLSIIAKAIKGEEREQFAQLLDLTGSSIGFIEKISEKRDTKGIFRDQASMDAELIKWIDKEVETRRFASRTHALELAISRLKNEIEKGQA